MFTQEVDAFLQDGGLVHLSGVAWQHGAKLFDEDIELVSPFLLRLVTGHTVIQSRLVRLDEIRASLVELYRGIKLTVSPCPSHLLPSTHQ